MLLQKEATDLWLKLVTKNKFPDPAWDCSVCKYRLQSPHLYSMLQANWWKPFENSLDPDKTPSNSTSHLRSKLFVTRAVLTTCRTIWEHSIFRTAADDNFCRRKLLSVLKVTDSAGDYVNLYTQLGKTCFCTNQLLINSALRTFRSGSTWDALLLSLFVTPVTCSSQSGHL